MGGLSTIFSPVHEVLKGTLSHPQLTVPVHFIVTSTLQNAEYHPYYVDWQSETQSLNCLAQDFHKS
jgi:hypothetical protein